MMSALPVTDVFLPPFMVDFVLSRITKNLTIKTTKLRNLREKLNLWRKTVDESVDNLKKRVKDAKTKISVTRYLCINSKIINRISTDLSKTNHR